MMLIMLVYYFHSKSKEDYRHVFSYLALEGILNSIVTSMREIELIEILPFSINNRLVKYQLKRVETINGIAYDISYFVYFEKDIDGIWKINRF